MTAIGERQDNWLPGQRFLASSVVAMRGDLVVMFKSMAKELTALVLELSISDTQPFPKSSLRSLLTRSGEIVTRYFVGSDGRHPYAADNVTPLAPYPKLLNKRLGQVLGAVTKVGQESMGSRLPKDLARWYMYGVYLPVESRLGEAARRPLRIVDRDPFANYDAPHFWVDPRGYTLSDRIWDTGTQTRTLIDQLLTAAVNGGYNAYNLSRLLEASIIPGRNIRSFYPYGKVVSYQAMRLARTELSRAHNQGTLVAARANPYVSGIDWALSTSHPKQDICDTLATVDGGGSRIKEPYSPFAAQVPPAHPQCICNSRQVVTRTPDDVVNELRAELQDSANQNIRPYINPLQFETFMRELMGGKIFGDAPYVG